MYNITVRARDTASNTRELAVVVTVTDVNERPDIDEDTVPSYVEIEYDFTGTRPDVHTFTATKTTTTWRHLCLVPARHGRCLPGNRRRVGRPDLRAGQPASARARCRTSSTPATTTPVTAAATPTPSSCGRPTMTPPTRNSRNTPSSSTVTDVNEVAGVHRDSRNGDNPR